MLELQHVKKSFDKLDVLKDVSLKVNDGETIVILGPSGSGKTTFLRCINFLEKADAGTLKVNGEEIDLRKASKKQILNIRRKTAFVFQNYGLFEHKTALQNIMEGLVVVQKKPKDMYLKGKHGIKKSNFLKKC